jgi:hypothetical protein
LENGGLHSPPFSFYDRQTRLPARVSSHFCLERRANAGLYGFAPGTRQADYGTMLVNK